MKRFLTITLILIFSVLTAYPAYAYDGVVYEYDFSKDTVSDVVKDFYCGDMSSLKVSGGKLTSGSALIRRGSYRDFTVSFDIAVSRGNIETALKSYYVSRIYAGDMLNGSINGLSELDGTGNSARPGYKGVMLGFSQHGAEVIVHTNDGGHGNIKQFFEFGDDVDFKSGTGVTVKDTDDLITFYVGEKEFAHVKLSTEGDAVRAEITDENGNVLAYTDNADVMLDGGAVGFISRAGSYSIGKLKMIANSGNADESASFSVFDHEKILLKAGEYYDTPYAESEAEKTAGVNNKTESGAKTKEESTESAEASGLILDTTEICVLIMFNVICIGIAAAFYIMSDNYKLILAVIAVMLVITLTGDILVGAGVIDIHKQTVFENTENSTDTVPDALDEEPELYEPQPIRTYIDEKGNTAQVKITSSDQRATDALGRELPTYEEVGPTKEGKYVGVFYLLWTTSSTRELNDNTRIWAQNPSNPIMGSDHEFHWWSEPEVGYADAADPWVIRRNMYYLNMAGVDYIYIDFTNGYIYDEAFVTLLETMLQMRAEGLQTPSIVPWCFGDDSGRYYDAGYLYRTYYSQEKYKTLWFYMDGKPLLCAKRVEDNVGQYTKPNYLPVLNNKEMCDFFTIRFAWTTSPSDDGHYPGEPIWRWSWLCPVFFYPYKSGVYAYGWDEDEKIAEQVTISGGSYCNYDTGRSEAKGKLDKFREKTTSGDGLYLERQFKFVMRKYPEADYLNIQGWNEWMAQYFPEHLQSGATSFGFVDQYNREFSRDLEPVKGAYTDNYFYQMCSIIRKFKGVEAPESDNGVKAIDINGSFDQWDGVKEYTDYYNDTTWRHGKDPTKVIDYINETGRNDIVGSKVSCDGESVYFMIQTAQDLTSSKDKNWMLLFIDGDNDAKTGFEGYDYLVNYDIIDDNTATICEYKDNIWQEIGTVSYRVNGSRLMIEVPRSAIGQTDADVCFGFHINDNVSNIYDLSRWFLEGDNAPERRNMYVFESDCEYKAEAKTLKQRDDPITYMKAADIDKSTLKNGLAVEKYYLEKDYGKQPEIELLMNAYGTEGNRIYQGVCENIELIKEPEREAYAIKYEGYVYIPEDSEITFTVTSDDGAVLYINDRVLVDNGGVHTKKSESASLRLGKGLHKFRLEYFENGNGNNLLEYECSVSGAGFYH